ncbi:hypothetical protein EZS27_000351 [termite gut metagenome]|uniref:Uncharacterized protein n=1 Tax=termite gut metagenome TaxID=433724 RepID=A0A5J4T3W9_9ZZZZ
MDKTLIDIWKQVEAGTHALNAFIDSGIPPVYLRRIAPFLKNYNKTKELLTIHIEKEEQKQAPQVPPIQLRLPFDSEFFEKTWTYWKEYRLEKFEKIYTGREEQMALNYLYKLSNGDSQTAILCLEYNMANGCNKMYPLPEKKTTQTKKTKSNELDDY